MTGSAKAPEIIKQAFYSESINPYTEPGVNVVEDDNVSFEKPIYTNHFYQDIFNTISNLIQSGERVITLGGDHSIAYPVIAAHSQHYSNIEILQIDAHSDLYENFEDNPYSHASPFARILENELAVRLVQIGIRCQTPHLKAQSEKFNVEVVEMKDYSINELPRFENPLYISLDLDALDPAFAPGVSHHEPGGFSSRQVLDLLHTIDVPIIGADIVEYNPIRDHVGITAALAAKLLKEIIGLMKSNG